MTREKIIVAGIKARCSHQNIDPMGPNGAEPVLRCGDMKVFPIKQVNFVIKHAENKR